MSIPDKLFQHKIFTNHFPTLDPLQIGVGHSYMPLHGESEGSLEIALMFLARQSADGVPDLKIIDIVSSFGI